MATDRAGVTPEKDGYRDQRAPPRWEDPIAMGGASRPPRRADLSSGVAWTGRASGVGRCGSAAWLRRPSLAATVKRVWAGWGAEAVSIHAPVSRHLEIAAEASLSGWSQTLTRA